MRFFKILVFIGLLPVFAKAQTCQANFSHQKGNCSTVYFQNLSVALGGISSYFWTFGDGDTSSAKNPIHHYIMDGTYAVQLMITDSSGCTDSHVDSVSINCGPPPPPCQASFSFYDTACGDLHFYSNNQGQGGFNYQWDFGDGNSGTGWQPWHSYQNDGSYVVCMTMYDNSGNCQSTYCDTVLVNCHQQTLCKADFYTRVDSSCRDIQFIHSAQVPPGSLNYWWDFGDGNNSQAANPIHHYANDGLYTPCLTVWDSAGCQAMYCDSLWVNCSNQPSCDADFYWAPDSICGDVVFQSVNQYPHGSMNYFWDFGDGNTSTSSSPVHHYANSGQYRACLTIQDSAGNCQDTYCDYVQVNCNGQSNCQPHFNSTFDSCRTYTFLGQYQGQDSVINWNWDFGDGNTGSGQFPSHSYAHDGSYSVCLTIETSDSCIATICHPFQVNCSGPSFCRADFLWSPDSICGDVHFNPVDPQQSGLTYFWDFGDGNSTLSYNPSHHYSSPGVYNACLTVMDSLGNCQANFCDTIVINCNGGPGGCRADYYWYPDSTCSDIQFVPQASGMMYYHWDFGDGMTSSAQSPIHHYPNNGLYTVCLSVMDSSGICQTTFCDSVYVNCNQQPPCQADFYWYPDSSCNDIQFVHLGQNPPGSLNYFWDFGDGNTSTASNPVHTYANDGVYPVYLTVWDSTGCQAAYADTVVVNCNQQPNCQAIYQYYNGNCPTVNFFDGSNPGNTQIINWFWDFGDGSFSGIQNPTHTYNGNGIYLACLTITTADSCTSTFCDTLSINCGGPSNCNADFYSYPDSLCGEFQFVQLAQPQPGYTYYWNFGDGTSATGYNPKHHYTSNGNYTACLTVVDSAGNCQASFCDSVSVNCGSGSNCQALFQVNANNCPAFSFFDASNPGNGQILSWYWDFGDGMSSTSPNPTHTYNSNGVYPVCLSVYTSDSCVSTYCDTLVVNCLTQPSCQAVYQYTLGNCPTVSFFDGSYSNTGNIVGWYWDFGDGGASTSQNPSHTYTANGTYAVCLTAFSDDSCVTTFCDSLTINCVSSSTCQSDFTMNTSNCPAISFTDQSTAGGNIISWYWDFGDGAYDFNQNPVHTYSSNGVYLVSLTVFTDDSCSSTAYDTLFVTCINQDSCQADFTHQANGCAVSFIDMSSSSSSQVIGWAWDFGDGNSSTAMNPSHVYDTAGVYVVCLGIITADSCIQTHCDTLQVSNCLGLENQEAFLFEFYPNPATEQLNLKFIQDEQEYTYEILNLMGERIHYGSQRGGQMLIDLEEIPEGTYLLRVQTGGEWVTKKFIRLRP